MPLDRTNQSRERLISRKSGDELGPKGRSSTAFSRFALGWGLGRSAMADLREQPNVHLAAQREPNLDHWSRAKASAP